MSSIPQVVCQWPAALADRLEQRLGASVHFVRTGNPFADGSIEQAKVLLAAPEGHLPAEAPPGWPYGIEWVQLVSSGTDHYPRWLLRSGDGAPRVTSGKGTSAQAMAEFAIASVFAHAKHFPELWISDPADWRFTRMGRVAGSTLGIAGFGVLGQAVARLALAVGMKVLAFKRGEGESPVPGVEIVRSLRALVAGCDHCVLLLPGDASTHRIVDRELLAAARPGLHLLNLGRGTLVDQDALLEALDAGRISRATLDVTEPEPLPAGHRLYSHPRVNLSPHTSVFADSTFEALLERVVGNLKRLAAGEPLDGEIA